MLEIKNFNRINSLDGVDGTIYKDCYKFRIKRDSLNVYIYRTKKSGKYEVRIIYDWSTEPTIKEITAEDVNTLDKMKRLLDLHRLPF